MIIVCKHECPTRARQKLCRTHIDSAVKAESPAKRRFKSELPNIRLPSANLKAQATWLTERIVNQDSCLD